MNREVAFKILHKAIEEYGICKLEHMFYEEVGELFQALNKYARNPNSKTLQNIHEEIADVQIVLTQLAFIFGFEECTKFCDKKLKRLSERLGI